MYKKIHISKDTNTLNYYLHNFENNLSSIADKHDRNLYTDYKIKY